MTDEQQCKRTFIWHYLPEKNELKTYGTMKDFRSGEPEFKPGDGTRVFKGSELNFRTVEKIVVA